MDYMSEKLINLIKRSGNYHLATVAINEPKLRVFGSYAVIDGEACICMGNQKDVYRQIKMNPKVALSGFIANYNWWRANATAVEITSEENKQLVFEQMPSLHDLYKGREHEFSVFALRDLTVEEY